MTAAFGYSHMTRGYAGGQAESALLMGAERVIAIDRYPHRLELARELGADIIDQSLAANRHHIPNQPPTSPRRCGTRIQFKEQQNEVTEVVLKPGAVSSLRH